MTIEIKRSQRTNSSINRYDYDVYDNGVHVATWTPKAWSARGYVLYDAVGEIVRPITSGNMFTGSIDVDTKAEFVEVYERNKKAVPTAAQIAERQARRVANMEAQRLRALEIEREECIRDAALDLYNAAKIALESGNMALLQIAVGKAEGS